MDCALIGDDIAVGLATQRFNCTIDAKVGISSAAIVGRAYDSDIMIVSAGSNDPLNKHLIDNLRAIRSKTKGQVIWIIPIHPKAAASVRFIANEFGDSVVTFTPGMDHVHPRSYSTLAADVRSQIKGR